MKKRTLFILFLLFSPLFVSAADEACFADRPCSTPEIEGRTWAVLQQLPTLTLKLNYFSSHVFLPHLQGIIFIYIILCLALAFLLISKRKKIKNILLTELILLIFFGLIYSVAQYYNQDVEQGIIICKNQNDCSLSQHTHADLEVSVCGKEHIFPFEKGDLDKAHTHKEKNKIHFHTLLKVDPLTNEILDPTELKIKSFFKQMGERFDANCILDKCNGDLCSTTPGKTSMTVNTIENSQLENYIWKDGDTIRISFE